jgi:DNA-binding CsgD family transcriptional regulator
VAAGHTSLEIAALLGIKPTTIETHIEHILRKIGGRSRIDIATWWQRQSGVPEGT